MPTPKRERQRANRAAAQAARLAERRRRRRQQIVIWAMVVAVVLGGLGLSLAAGGFGSPTTTLAAVATTPTTTPVFGPTDYAGFRAQPTACGADAPPEAQTLQFAAPVDQALSGTVTATLETSCGPIEISMDADAYPETVNSFVFLARQGYFDGTVCHRIPRGFVVQCGDPTATGTGGPGYVIADEFPQTGFVYSPGVVAMANAGAGTTGSQFFIVTGDASFLPNNYSILGTVVGSQDTLAALDTVPLGYNAAPNPELSDPLETVYIDSVTISG